jgi:hypothetical protein
MFNPYGAGAKVYGLSGRPHPTAGPVDKTGYRKRDMEYQRRKRNAMLRRMKAKQQKRYMSSDYLKGK